jgi:hypothetical protein
MLTTSGELVMSATMLESPQDLSKEARLIVSQEVPIAEGASHSRAWTFKRGSLHMGCAMPLEPAQTPMHDNPIIRMRHARDALQLVRRAYPA